MSKKVRGMVVAVMIMAPLAEAQDEAPVFRDRLPDGMVECPKVALAPKVDRFSGSTSISTSPRASGSPHPLEPHLMWTSEAPDKAMLMFMGVSQRWKYLECHTTHILVDGRRLDLPAAGHRGDVLATASVLEQVHLLIPFSTAREIAAARLVEYKVCNDEFRAPPDFLCEAKALVRAVDERSAKR
ncbi:MAG TPA: hypothetical protein VLT87_11095 [Thermoanaerobaculia bacterium]|nr:hypothetical protein [Thermoanaerobaculia bacterium]